MHGAYHRASNALID